MSWWSDWLQATENSLSGANEQGAVNTATSIVPGLGFLQALTDAAFWRSLAWLSLGITMAALGLLLLLRGTVEKAAGDVAKAVAL
jgi:hypothetical protein